MKYERTYAGGDLAFTRDRAALVLVAREDTIFHVVVCEELTPTKGKPLVPSVVCKRFAEIMKTHNAKSIMLDRHYLESAREHFHTEGILVESAPETQDGKAETYLHVRELLAERRLRIPLLGLKLKGQLKAIVSKPTPGGSMQISAPRRGGGGHSDLVSALVLACWAAKNVSTVDASLWATPLPSDSRWAPDPRFPDFGSGRGFG